MVKGKAVDSFDTIILTGIGKGSVKTLGSLILELKFNDNCSIKHTFHKVPNDFQITEDGIIGRDFFDKFQVDICTVQL